MQEANAPSGRRQSVDVSGFPDLVVVYLGFRVGAWRAIGTVFGIGRGLEQLDRDRPDGLLRHEYLLYGLNHIGMRQYWRDLESLEAFTRSEPHKTWWKDYLNDPLLGFWHEAYRVGGGMEAIYVGMPKPIGLGSFAQARKPVGPFMSSRQRLAA